MIETKHHQYYTEERNGGTYYIPKGIWRKACDALSAPDVVEGECKVCFAKNEPLYNGVCLGCAIFSNVLEIAEANDIPIFFSSLPLR